MTVGELKKLLEGYSDSLDIEIDVSCEGILVDLPSYYPPYVADNALRLVTN